MEGDLSSEDALRRGVKGCDAVIHGAAIYKVGMPKSAHDEMWNANVHGTERVLDAAIEAGIPRIVYVSTVNVFGNTRGEVVDESYERRIEDGLPLRSTTRPSTAHTRSRRRGSPPAPRS